MKTLAWWLLQTDMQIPGMSCAVVMCNSDRRGTAAVPCVFDAMRQCAVKSLTILILFKSSPSFSVLYPFCAARELVKYGSHISMLTEGSKPMNLYAYAFLHQTAYSVSKFK